MPVLQNPRIFAVREDSRVCDQRSAVSAQPLPVDYGRLAPRSTELKRMLTALIQKLKADR
jgi:hypothetical protein